MKENHRVKGVIFDLDGTLIDSYQAIYLSFKFAYEGLGLPPLSFDQVKRAVGLGLGHTFRDFLGEERVPQALSLFRSHYEQVFRANTHLLPDVRLVLETLSARGIRQGVATNKLGRFSREILGHFGLEPLFAVIVGDGDVSQTKPHPEMIHYALGKMEVGKEEAVFVGDSVIDIRTAGNAGLRVLAVPTGNTPREDLEEARPTVLLDRLADLLSYVS